VTQSPLWFRSCIVV